METPVPLHALRLSLVFNVDVQSLAEGGTGKCTSLLCFPLSSSAKDSSPFRFPAKASAMWPTVHDQGLVAL